MVDSSNNNNELESSMTMVAEGVLEITQDDRLGGIML
jgi:hypothetical protein